MRNGLIELNADVLSWGRPVSGTSVFTPLLADGFWQIDIYRCSRLHAHVQWRDMPHPYGVSLVTVDDGYGCQPDAWLNEEDVRPYLQKLLGISSVGLERLTLNQDVGGSNPSSPANSSESRT